jgi:hypothetical protein
VPGVRRLLLRAEITAGDHPEDEAGACRAHAFGSVSAFSAPITWAPPAEGFPHLTSTFNGRRFRWCGARPSSEKLPPLTICRSGSQP